MIEETIERLITGFLEHVTKNVSTVRAKMQYLASLGKPIDTITSPPSNDIYFRQKVIKNENISIICVLFMRNVSNSKPSELH